MPAARWSIELLPEPVRPSKMAKDEKMPLEAIFYQQLIEIWMDILKVPHLTIEDNFFALGGSSLLALRMMTQIEKLCGRPLPLSLLVHRRDHRESRPLYHRSQQRVDRAADYGPGQGQPSAAFFPARRLGGRRFLLRTPLASSWARTSPFTRCLPIARESTSVLSLEEMAAYHIAAIREHTPHGPYLLGGYCIGATVAMEVARQLVGQGETVTRLLLIDPPQTRGPLAPLGLADDRQTGRVESLGSAKEDLLLRPLPVSLSRWLRKPARSKWSTLLGRLGLAGTGRSRNGRVGGVAGVGDAEILNSLDYAVYFLAYRLYRLRPFSVPATLYFPEESPPAHHPGLSARAGISRRKLCVEMVPGNHHTCITRYTSVMAERMRRTLEGILDLSATLELKTLSRRGNGLKIAFRSSN